MADICDDKDVVMVVDDEEVIEKMIQTLVESHGCSHVSFNDPLKALQYYR